MTDALSELQSQFNIIIYQKVQKGTASFCNALDEFFVVDIHANVFLSFIKHWKA